MLQVLYIIRMRWLIERGSYFFCNFHDEESCNYFKRLTLFMKLIIIENLVEICAHVVNSVVNLDSFYQKNLSVYMYSRVNWRLEWMTIMRSGRRRSAYVSTKFNITKRRVAEFQINLRTNLKTKGINDSLRSGCRSSAHISAKINIRKRSMSEFQIN